MYTTLPVIEGIRDQVAASPIPIVFDHFGGAQASPGIDQPGFAALQGLVRSGKAYVKISGAYRSSNAQPDYADVAPLAKALIAANPQRIVWGSDWPHPDSSRVAGRKATDVAPLLQIDDGRLLNQLAVWTPDAARRKLILVDNAARLYGY
jgi:predicted TIM-barrel fold metal-dependent hydrolase